MSSTSTQDPSQALPPETFLEVLSASRDSATMARSSGVNKRWREIILSSISKYQNLSVDLDIERNFELYREEQKQGLGHKGKEEREEKELERCSTLMRHLSDRSLNKLISVDLRLDSLFWYKFDLQFHQGSHLEKIFNTLLLSKVTLQTLSIHFKEEYEWEDYHHDEWMFLINFLENFPNLKCAELEAPSPLNIKTQRLSIETTTREFMWEAEEILPIFKRAVEYGGAIMEFSLSTEMNESDAEQKLKFLQELMLHKDTLEVLNLKELTDYTYEKALELIVSCPNLISLKFPQFIGWALPDEEKREKVRFGIQDHNLSTPPIKKFDFSCNSNLIKILWNAPLIEWLGQNLEILHLTTQSEDSKSPFMPLESLFSIFENNSQSLREISLRGVLLEGKKEVNFVPANLSLCFPNLKSIKLFGTSEPKVISFFSCSILPSLSIFDIKPEIWGRYCLDPHVIPHSDLLRLLESSSSTLEQVTLTQVHVARLPDSPTQGITFPKMRILTIDACSEELFQASLSFYCPQLKIWEFINDRADLRTYNTQPLLPTFPSISEKLYSFLSSSQSSIVRILMEGVDLEDSKQEPNSQQLLTFPSLESLEFKRTNDSLVKFFSYHSFPSLLKLKEKQRYETFISLFTPKAEKDSARK